MKRFLLEYRYGNGQPRLLPRIAASSEAAAVDTAYFDAIEHMCFCRNTGAVRYTNDQIVEALSSLNVRPVN